MKLRLDQLLVDRGLAPSKERAQSLIMAGMVFVEGQKSEKPGISIKDAARVELVEACPYASRGGYKLAGALDEFQIKPEGRVCLDAGSSTGGFTDCLLQRGATRVYAYDVGAGLLDWKLRNDPRVIVREGNNVRYLKPADLPEEVDMAVCDVSFISVTLIVPAVVAVLTGTGEMVILIKPQFEAPRDSVGKGGIVRDPEVHRQVIEKVTRFVSSYHFQTVVIPSPILGAEGNQEFLLYAHH